MNIYEKIGDIQDCVGKFSDAQILEMLEELKEDLKKSSKKKVKDLKLY